MQLSCQTRLFNSSNTSQTEQTNPSKNFRLLDVNDVSFLFPLPKNLQELAGLLKISQPGQDGQPLMPQDIFNLVKAKGEEAGIQFDTARRGQTMIPLEAHRYDAWRVVGMRFDPCANSTTHKSINTNSDLAGCIFELRLTAQPLQPAPTAPSIITPEGTTLTTGPEAFATDDFALHLIYSIPQEKQAEVLSSLVSDLREIKNSAPLSTTGLPLGIHPAMLKEGTGTEGKYAKRVRQTILKHFGGTKLTSVALSGLMGKADIWGFMAVPVDMASRAVGNRFDLKEIENDKETANGKTLVKLFLCCDIIPKFTEPKPNIEDFFLLNHRLRQKTTEKERIQFFSENQAAYKSGISLALQLENPQERTQFQGNCVTCHVATPFKEKALSALGSNLGVESRFRPSTGPTNKTDPNSINKFIWNLRNFGYRGHEPGVSQRTTNESAEVAALVSRLVH